MNRNSLCSCGSGKRFKHCCGRAPEAPVRARYDALAAHQAGELGRAETLYQRAVAEDPNDVDSLHMLGVVQMQRLRYREALDLLWDVAEKTGWAVPQVRHNIGLVLSKLLTREANVKQSDLLADFIAWERAVRERRIDTSPRVTVVMRAHNQARHVAQAIESVAVQTYPHLELVVIDDGSDDDTREAIAQCVRHLSIPVRVIAREHRGLCATLNEGAALAGAGYVAFLDADDRYAPERIASLVEEIAGSGLPWGFSLVSSIGPQAGADTDATDHAIDISWRRQRNYLGKYSNSFSLLEHNIAVTPGNLFVDRDFFRSLQGFREPHGEADWDFCLRANALAEPLVVNRPLYFCRYDADAESQPQAAADAMGTLSAFLAAARAGEPCVNPLAPQWAANRTLLLKVVLGAAKGAALPVPVLRSLASEWRAAPRLLQAADAAPAIASSARKRALIVLGMHRSGTSALSRVLNLCGAFLPAKLKPAKIGVNDKGFWEPEEVLEFNGRVLRQLGGEWNQVNFTLPSTGDFVDEFVSDARALLESEYGDEPDILIKDPRLCVLAPLWHRVLESAGYAAAYVVPMRNPLEVAQSLHARGDMSVVDGLKLWLAYMQRVVAFADTHPQVMFIRFDDLLGDWRTVVTGIARRLATPLDIVARADEVDRFLEQSLRNQTATDEALALLATDAALAPVTALYRECLARCDVDAGAAAPAGPRIDISDTMGRNGPTGAGRADVPLATATFVLCIESNAIREQALLLCESIRRFGGRYSHAPIMAFAPRPGLGVDQATQRQLAQMDVEYVDLPLNTTCTDYAPANRVFAGAWAERHAATDFLVVIDSDTVWFGAPELPEGADACVRPVDFKGSATRGPGDRFEEYWARLAALAGVSLERLPMLRSTVGNESIRASYNAGLTAARRDKGIFTGCAELFAASLVAGIRPYQGTGVNIVASTGHVGEAGSEYWGSSQAAMTLAIWKATDRVLHYPDHYNVPLHLIAADGEIDPRWLRHFPVHLHYHWMFSPQHRDNALELMATLGVPAEMLAWTRERTPLATQGERARLETVAAR